MKYLIAGFLIIIGAVVWWFYGMYMIYLSPPKLVADPYYKGYIIYDTQWAGSEVQMLPDSSFKVNDGFFKKGFSKEFVYPEGTAQIIFSKYKAWREAGHK